MQDTESLPPMRSDDVTVIIQIAALSIAALVEYMRNAPRTSAESDALDLAALELIMQTSQLADVVRVRLGKPDSSDCTPA